MRCTTARPVWGSEHSLTILYEPPLATLHQHHDSLRAVDEIHRPTHALDYLAGDHPVRDVASGADLHRAQDGHVDLAARDHTERQR
jgi:hypothetical protein